jgi:hydroxymethylpyrimidine/phosphomethylpyrimidine kinase
MRLNMIKHTALTIAGSDSSGGAGIQADLKAMLACGVFGMSAITAITAQNTTGVKSIMQVTPDILSDQLDMVFTDIYPEAVKVGMTFNCELIKVISDKLSEYNARNIVVDPVMVATSGARLIDEKAIDSLCKLLLPKADLITPNIPEAMILSGLSSISNEEDMLAAARIMGETFGCCVLVKGGHMSGDESSADVLYKTDNSYFWYTSPRIDNPNTHGTGCTLSSAIASYLAKGDPMEIAISKAKNYLSKAIAAGLNLGKGSGPLWHMTANVSERSYSEDSNSSHNISIS